MPFDSDCTNFQDLGGAGDTPYIYTGGEGGGATFDIGLQKLQPAGQTQRDAGWVPFCTYQWGKTPEAWVATDPKAHLGSPAIESSAYRFHGSVEMSLQLPDSDGGAVAAKTVHFGLYITNQDGDQIGTITLSGSTGGPIAPTSIYLIQTATNVSRSTYESFHFKRVNSIAQILNDPNSYWVQGRGGANLQANAPASKPKNLMEYFADPSVGSQVLAGGWGDEGGDPGVWIDGSNWDATITYIVGSTPLNYPALTPVIYRESLSPWYVEPIINISTQMNP